MLWVLRVLVMRYVIEKVNPSGGGFVFQIRWETEIAAPIDRVWEALLDFDSWSEWSEWTVFEGVEQPAQSGSTGTLVVHFDGKGSAEQRYPFSFKEIDGEQHLLNWHGSVLGGYLFYGNHWMRLKEGPSTDGQPMTILEHGEDMMGLLPALGLAMPYAKVRRNYKLMNEELKSFIEGNDTKV